MSSTRQEIGTKASFFHELFQVAIRSRDNERVDVSCLGVSDPVKLPGVQKAKQFHLDRPFDIADLVQKHDPTVRDLEIAFLVASGFGESAFHVPEELRLDEIGSKSRDGNGHVRFSSLGGGGVGAGEELLAGTCLSPKKNPRTGLFPSGTHKTEPMLNLWML